MEDHLQIINPRFEESFSFEIFPLLPVELRLHIWELSLKRHRLIEVRLHPSGPHYHDVKYFFTCETKRQLSKLLRVNSEARAVALRFYRVKIRSRRIFPFASDWFLHLNPEYDILYINTACWLTPLFLCDLRAKDPLNVGVCNLAFNDKGVSQLTPIGLSSLPAVERVTFTQTINDLHKVFFFIAYAQNGIRTLAELELLGLPTDADDDTRFEYHRSRPIMSSPCSIPISSFDCLPRDPRANIEQDLSRVYMGMTDPRQMIYRWRCCLRQWGIQTAATTPECRLLITTYDKIRVIDRNSVLEVLRRSENLWIEGTQRFASKIIANGGKFPVESPEELAQAPRPALGFWSFPIEALGKIPEPKESAAADPLADEDEIKWVRNEFKDMRSHWPELCLIHVP
ncbi:hypothetical protein F5Y18DRAFT_352604 [Xylariaceae sp. FL1019]|nr:hypothetical protein F5Y18DRAFT_352604 [Xylariaceae sp. FL1019]